MNRTRLRASLHLQQSRVANNTLSERVTSQLVPVNGNR